MGALGVVHFTEHKPTVITNSAGYTILNNLHSFLFPLESPQPLSGIASRVCM
jgi:hypothetical protein